ncbi:MAG TPA: cyanophycin synthetase, partial [Caulobacteraceae bacterium]
MALTVLERSVYRGPNIHSHRAMIRIELDLGELEAWPTHRLEGFSDRLLEALPSLAGHGCSYREAGGFVRRLREGTWLGHVVEHLALELQTLAGAATTRGKTRSVRGRPGVYNVMYVYEDEAVGLLAGRTAIELVDSLLPDALRGAARLSRLAPAPEPEGPFDLARRIEVLARMQRRASLGPSTKALVDEARRRRIPVRRMDEQSLVQLGWGSRQKRLRASVTGSTSLIGAELAGDKALAKRILA